MDIEEKREFAENYIFPIIDEMMNELFQGTEMYTENDLLNHLYKRLVVWTLNEGKGLCTMDYLSEWNMRLYLKEIIFEKLNSRKIMKVEDCFTKYSRKSQEFKHCLYRFRRGIGDPSETVLYVGRSKDVITRIGNHSHLPKECYCEAWYIEYAPFPSEDDLDIAERYFIAKWKPEYNKDFKDKNFSFSIEYLDNLRWNLLPGYANIIKGWKEEFSYSSVEE